MYRSVYTGSMPGQMPPHAYVEWKGAGLSKNMLTRRAGFFVGWSCIYIIPGKWMQMVEICLPNSAYATKIHIVSECLRTPTQTAKYQVNSLRSFIRSSLEHMRSVIQKKNDAAHFDSGSEFIKWSAAQNKTIAFLCISHNHFRKCLPFRHSVFLVETKNWKRLMWSPW